MHVASAAYIFLSTFNLNMVKHIENNLSLFASKHLPMLYPLQDQRQPFLSTSTSFHHDKTEKLILLTVFWNEKCEHI
jgi:hypothetical protein